MDMTDIIVSTGLSVDDLIEAKLKAHNGRGYGSFSELNIAGSTLEVDPA